MGKIHCRITRRNGVSGTDQQKECLRATISSSHDTNNRQMGEDSTHASSFNNIDMAAAIETIKTYLGMYLSCGETVHLDGIGSFQLSIGLKEMTPATTKITARQIEVKGITFRPADSLMARIKDDVHFVIAEDKRDLAREADGIDLLRSYMARCRDEGRMEVISIRRFAAICNCSYATAYRRVRALLADGYLVRSSDMHNCYVPGPAL